MQRKAENLESRRRAFRLRHAARRHAIAWAVAVTLLCAPPLATAAKAADDSLVYEGFLGLGSAIGSLIYSPIKVTYAVGGTALSAVTLIWTFGDANIAGSIFSQTVGGDYVVVPGHLQAERKLVFLGPR